MASNDNSSIPRFSSFKPRATSTTKESPALSTGQALAGHTEKHHRKKHRDERKVEDKSRSHGSVKRDRSRSKERGRKASRVSERRNDYLEDRSPRKTPHSPLSIAPQETGDEKQQSYFIDRYGDPDNIRYGGLYRRDIPVYRRHGSGYVVGLQTSYRIDRESSDDQHVVISDTRRAPRAQRLLTSKAYRPRNQDDEFVTSSSKLTMNMGESPQAETKKTEDYIPIGFGMERTRNSKSPETSSDDIDYRSIEGKAKALQQRPESKLESVSRESNSWKAIESKATAEDELIKQQTTELSRRTRAEPRNLQAWLDLINHQDQVAQLGRRGSAKSLGFGQMFTAKELRSISEVKIAMYEQALDVIGNNEQDQINLLLGMLEEGAKVWDSGKLSKRWQEALSAHSSSIDLWTKYIDYFQTDFVHFRYEEAKEIYCKCLRVLSTISQQRVGDAGLCSRLQSVRLYVITRLTSMMSKAGYTEHAIATWQGLFEYTFFRPSSASALSPSDLMMRLEEFWEAEVPRIGEENALGWSNYDSGALSMLKSARNAPKRNLSPTRPFPSFYEVEQTQTNFCQYPGRTTDDDTDDPYHVVLFSDVSPYLSELLWDYSHDSLVEAFLNFFGLPRLSSSGQASESPEVDAFTANLSEWHSSARPAISHSELNSTGNSFSEHLKWISRGIPPRIQITDRDLFKDAFNVNLNQQNVNFVRELLSQVLSVCNDERIAEYYLGFLRHFFPREAAKMAKRLLKRMPSSLRLYNAYALIEASTGDMTKANMVFSTALSMSGTLPEGRREDSIVVLRSWVWETLHSGDPTVAYERLLSFASERRSPEEGQEELLRMRPAAVLKAKRLFMEGRDNALSTNKLLHAIIFTECLALLSYLQHGSDLSSALQVFHKTSSLLSARGLAQSPANELNHQALGSMLSFHLSGQKQFRPSLICEQLGKSITLFPNNTNLLCLFAANESRFRIEDRVRIIIRDTVLKQNEHSSIVGWMFAIHAEKQRGPLAGSTSHSVRALYERAVDSQAGKHSLALWRSFVEFELESAASSASFGHNKKSGLRIASSLNPFDRVKQVFFRGLICLPWCKDYMMMAFTPKLRDSFSIEELRKVWNVMEEKEIRVFADLEPVFDKIERDLATEGASRQMAIRSQEDNDSEAEDEG